MCICSGNDLGFRKIKHKSPDGLQSVVFGPPPLSVLSPVFRLRFLLGNYSPDFHLVEFAWKLVFGWGLKVYETTKKELVLEPDIRWVALATQTLLWQ
nr:hypothetical protein Iba_chr04aCG7300 [Ipomoea batatas]